MSRITAVPRPLSPEQSMKKLTLKKSTRKSTRQAMPCSTFVA
jgi:hypothetical protein